MHKKLNRFAKARQLPKVLTVKTSSTDIRSITIVEVTHEWLEAGTETVLALAKYLEYNGLVSIGIQDDNKYVVVIITNH